MSAWILALTLVGCGDDSGAPASADDTAGPSTVSTPGVTAPPTLHGTVRPLVDRHCVGCHSEGAIGPFALDTPEAVQQLQELVVWAIEDRSMPPWGMDPACHDTVGDLRLSDAEVATVLAWRDAGFPEGDPLDYVAPEVPTPVDPGPPDLVLAPEAAYLPNEALIDDYRCLPVQETLDDDLFLTGIDVQPGNVDLVHHVLIYAIPPAGHDALDALDAEDPEPGYACFGTSGLAQAQTVGGWVPGSSASLYDAGVAQRVPAGSRLVLQMHYNTTAGVTDTDLTRVHLWSLPDGEVPDQLLTVFPIPKLSLDIAAGDAESVQVARQRLPIPEGSVVVATAPHMHLLGTSLSSKVVRADGTEQCLSQVDDWDFHWQRTYTIPEGQRVPLSVHDEVEIVCTYDNSAANQPVVDGVPLEPRDVGWGDGSFDEMCLDYVGLLRAYSGHGGTGTCAEYEGCMEGCAPGDGICAATCMTASGEACLYCGLEGLFGDCVGAQHCPLPGLALLTCMEDCATTYEDQFACLYDDCRSAFDGYMACAEAPLASGACVADFEGCEVVGGG